MSNKGKNETVCPHYEEVSAFFDNELDPLSPEYRHIKECDKCANLLEEFSTIRKMVDKELEDAVPDNFTENLIAALERRLDTENLPAERKLFPMLMRVAALLFLAGVMLYVLLPANNKEEPGESIASASAEPLIFLNKATPPSTLSSLDIPSPHRVANEDNGAIDVNNLINVSSNRGIDDADYSALLKSEEPKVASIAPEVSQVWSVDNLTAAKEKVAEFADNVKFADNPDGNIVFKASLTKKQLAELVRRCKDAGFRLLSPSAPQPEQTTFAGNGNEKVNYSGLMVECN